MVKIVILLITIVAVLGRFGANGRIVAVLGGLGLAVGLALQGSLSNVASGAMLLLLRPFRREVVKLGGTVYIVDDIGLFVTAVHQPDGSKVWLSNNQVWGSEIVNLSVFMMTSVAMMKFLVLVMMMISTKLWKLFVGSSRRRVVS